MGRSPQSKPWLREALVFFFLGAFMTTGIVVWYVSIPLWQLYDRSAHWDRVEATVTAISRQYVHTGSGRNAGRVYFYHAEYEFTYAGRRWRGHDVNFTGQRPPEAFVSMYDQDQEDASHRRAPQSHKILAWVNPANPYESVLYRQIVPEMWGPRLLGTVFTGFAVLFGLGWYGLKIARATRRRRASAGQNVYADQRFSAGDDQ